MRRFILILCLLVILSGASLATAQEENALGKKVYDKWCEQCHGLEGKGDGVAASRLKPRPRDFTTGKYKVRTTLTGDLPTDEDLKNAVRRGLYYSAMPAFTNLNETEIDAVVQYIKTFSADFADPELTPKPITIPTPPPFNAEKAAVEGKQIYEETGCGRCHGELGRGDGSSAPTLVDDWGNHVRIADLTMPWTFRGGGSRRDIYRTMSTGFFGTPMPGFYGNLGATQEESDQRMWAIVDYMYYLAGLESSSDDEMPEAPYKNLLTAVGTTAELDVSQGKELFQGAPKSMFPIIGQIIEPGRNFHPSIYAVNVQAVYNDDEIAFLLTWNDMRAETSGTNAPDLAAPLWDEELAALGLGGGGGDDAEEDIWGEAAEEDIWGDAAESEDEGGDDDFWGEDEDAAPAASGGLDTEFNDAVALQFPAAAPTGVRRPYFIFGDVQNPVDIWFQDLGATEAAAYVGRGSAAVVPSDGEAPISWSQYEQGEWSVIFKRQRKSRSAINFEEGSYVSIAFSVWDGFNRERGNKRTLSGWRYVYMEPRQEPEWKAPAAKTFAGIFVLEILLIGLVRRSKRRKESS
jgi:mono/diheme cytochrome c family protein